MVLGTIWEIPACSAEIERESNEIKTRYDFNNKEFHWSEIKKLQVPIYCELIDMFIKYMRQGQLKFWASVVDQHDRRHKIYSKDDELHFYKMYFWLIFKRLNKHNKYDIYLDRKNNAVDGRLSDLKNYLNMKSMSSNIVRRVEARDGSQIELQLADIFAGAIAYVINGQYERNKDNLNNPKVKIINYIQDKLERELRTCNAINEATDFNIWCFTRQ